LNLDSIIFLFELPESKWATVKYSTVGSYLMPKYMYSGNYNQKGVAGLLKDGGRARHAEAKRIAEGIGGTLEAYYWAYGSTDFFMIMDVPSEALAIKLSLRVGASGVFSGNLTPLISVEQMEEAITAELPEISLPGE